MGLGMGEIVILLVIAYVVVGPEDMVKFARKLGAALRQLNKLRAEVSTKLTAFGNRGIESVVLQLAIMISARPGSVRTLESRNRPVPALYICGKGRPEQHAVLAFAARDPQGQGE